MWRSVLRAAIKSPNQTWNPVSSSSSSHHHRHQLIFFSSKANKSGGKKDANANNTNVKKGKTKKGADQSSSAIAVGDVSAQADDATIRARQLAEDEKNPSINMGPNGLPLFTSAASLAKLTRNDACSYFNFSQEELRRLLPEGLPVGMVKEFEDSMRKALLVRQSFLDLRDNFRRIVDPSLFPTTPKGLKVRKQIVLDGPVSSGKSIMLAMLVHWAREEGWIVFYVPRGREWTHGGFCYKNPDTGLWDTPLLAENALKEFLKFHASQLKQLPCQIFDPVPLGEGAGVGWMKGVVSMSVPEESTLYDLAQIGINHTHAAVGAIVRLRKELSLVKDVPVLFAIDQYNNWFTFSDHEEPVTMRSCRQIHARELSMVNACRSMMHNDMMVGAFTHSTAVGKLRKDLPDVPPDARINLSRYSLDEAAAVCHYYLRQRLIRREAFSEDNWKRIFYLSNGNGVELRSLVPLMQCLGADACYSISQGYMLDTVN